jgi:hypothetical protein
MFGLLGEYVGRLYLETKSLTHKGCQDFMPAPASL